jgi:hypothetical protein
MKDELPVRSPCACGRTPGIFLISGSVLHLRVVGCTHCRITGKARRTDAEAIRAWNEEPRNGSDGEKLRTKTWR